MGNIVSNPVAIIIVSAVPVVAGGMWIIMGILASISGLFYYQYNNVATKTVSCYALTDVADNVNVEDPPREICGWSRESDKMDRSMVMDGRIYLWNGYLNYPRNGIDSAKSGPWNNSDHVIDTEETVLRTYPNGMSYRGSYNEGEYDKGVMTYPNGDFYVGEYENNKPDGTGRYVWNDGLNIWDKGYSTWQAKKTNLKIEDFENEKNKLATFWQGNWKDGNRNGDGKYFAPNKEATEEVFKNGYLTESYWFAWLPWYSESLEAKDHNSPSVEKIPKPARGQYWWKRLTDKNIKIALSKEPIEEKKLKKMKTNVVLDERTWFFESYTDIFNFLEFKDILKPNLESKDFTGTITFTNSSMQRITNSAWNIKGKPTDVLVNASYYNGKLHGEVKIQEPGKKLITAGYYLWNKRANKEIKLNSKFQVEY